MPDRALAFLAAVPFLLGAAATPNGQSEVLCTFQDPAIVEASALVVTKDGLVVTSNDSGDTGRVFAVDHRTGKTVGVTRWSDSPTDVESLAPGPRRAHGGSTVWVGDIGDNSASRDSVQIALVPIGRGDLSVQPIVYDLTYPDGAHDAETLVRDPVTGRLYIATKGVLGGALYAAPKRLSAGGTNRLTEVGPVLAVATDGAFFPDGKHLIVRSYAAATVYAFPSLREVRTLRLPAQPQGEGIGTTARGRLLLDSEGVHSAVLTFPLPSSLVPTVEPGRAPASTFTDAHSPSAARSASTTSPADHAAYWLVAAVVVLVGAAAVAFSRRRRRR